jgi:malonyl CoA-acyl carrier protein transacylase/NAD(P)-dependent dehydrogenase (short-subunit alcohol dehydrogenase family)
VAESAEGVVDALVTGDPEVIRDHSADEVRRDVAFLFAGGGAQYPGMARGLYASEETFRKRVDGCLDRLEPELRAQVRSLLLPHTDEATPLTPEEAERPSIALPALFIVQYAQAELWMSWGVRPAAMIGHSMGEYTAACLAGVFSLEEALELVVLRGRLFERVSGGGMLSVPLSEDALRPLLGDELSVAAVNAPELCVASGPRDAIDRLERSLAEREIEARRIHIDVAAHSSMLEPILEDFGARLAKARMEPPRIPFASNRTGGWIRDEDATDPAYWVRQLRETVRFSEGLAEVLKESDRILLEVGPGRTLATLARLHPDRDPKQETFTSLRHPDDQVEDEAFLLDVVGGLWQHGVEIDWSAFHGGGRRCRISLPTYPFESEHHFVEGGPLPSTHRMRVVEAGEGAGGVGEGRDRSDDASAARTVEADGSGMSAAASAGTQGATSSGDPAPADDGPSDPLEWLHRIEWVAAPLSEAPDADGATGEGHAAAGHASGTAGHSNGAPAHAFVRTSLVVGSAEVVAQVAAALSDAFPDDPVIRVTFGRDFERNDDGWTLPPGDVEAAARLLEEVIDQEGLPARIVHAGALGLPSLEVEDGPVDSSPDPASEEEWALAEVEAGAFFSLFALGRALGEQVDDDEVELVVLTEGAVRLDGEPATSPAGSLVAGPVRVLPAEIPGIRTRWIDLPPEGLGKGRSGMTLLTRELAHGDVAHIGVAGNGAGNGVGDGPAGATPGTGGRAQQVALRPTGRFVPTYEAVAGSGGSGTGARPDRNGAGKGADTPDPEASSSPSRLSDDAVCLVTGGFGGLGLEVARHLARQSEARIVLLGRTPLPERERWDGAEARGEDPRILRAIATIRELEGSGARVLPVAADVTDVDQLREVRDQILTEFGSVDVVFHAAGVLEDGLAVMKAPKSAARVLAPKVRGALALARVFRDPAPSQLVLFSSVSAEAGLPGQIDYTSANAFLDAVAHNGNGAEGPRVTSIGWSAWRETGMAVDAASGLVHWPPLTPPSGGGLGGWRDAKDPRFDATDLEAGRVRVRLRSGRLWLLDEHRTRDGTPLVPGAGFMELLRGAAEELGIEGPLRFEELYFLAPFLVPEGETREMELRVPAEGDGEVVVLGRGRPDEEWVEHVKGQMVPGDDDDWSPSPPDGSLDAIRARTRALGAGEWTGRQDLKLGARWENLRGMAVGEREVLLTLELSDALRSDLETHALHPALLDNATAVAGPLLPGFGEPGTIHVPASYGRFEVLAPLPSRIRSHIRIAESEEVASEEMTALDVTLYDEDGRRLVEARSFILVRIDADDISRVVTEAREVRTSRQATVGAAAAEGVPTRIGLGIIDRVLGDPGLPRHLLVSPEPMAERIRTLRERAGATGSRGADGPDVDVGPVEAALVAMEAVTEAAVTAHEDRPGEIRLVAHVVLDPNRFATVSELRRGLRGELPSELVPQNFVQLDALPRTARGTVKRRALKDPFAPIDDHVPPETPTQEVVAGIWADLLGADRVGIHDNFLDVGGHSLLAMRAILRTEKATGVRLGPVEMNLYTLEQIAAHIDAEGGTVSPAGEEAPGVSSPKDKQVEEPAEVEDPTEEPAGAAEGKSGRSGFLDAMRKFIPGG